MSTKIDLNQLREASQEFVEAHYINKSFKKLTFYDYNKLLSMFVKHGEEVWMDVRLYLKEKDKGNNYFFKRVKGMGDDELLICFQLSRYIPNGSGFNLSGTLFKGYINRCQDWVIKETVDIEDYPWFVNDEDKEPVKLGRNDRYIKIYIRPVLGEELYKV
jgi:hypothetical protein